ncbi:hypothetical protein [Streptomyces sp. NPDC059850]
MQYADAPAEVPDGVESTFTVNVLADIARCDQGVRRRPCRPVA